MEIRMKVELSGRDKDGPYRVFAGQVTDRFPEAKAARFVRSGLAEAVTTLPQLDHDHNGAAGGSSGADEVVAASHGYELARIGGGWWQITGPGIDGAEKVKGKTTAETRFAKLAGEAEATAEQEPPAE